MAATTVHMQQHCWREMGGAPPPPPPAPPQSTARSCRVNFFVGMHKNTHTDEDTHKNTHT
eukprot:c54688_g1_i1 orf=1-177(-)